MGAVARETSLPHDLLELLRADNNDEDILDFANLEWVLDTAVVGGGAHAAHLSAPIHPTGPVPHSDSGSASRDAIMGTAATAAAAAVPVLPNPWSVPPLLGVDPMMGSVQGDNTAPLYPYAPAAPLASHQPASSGSETIEPASIAHAAGRGGSGAETAALGQLPSARSGRALAGRQSFTRASASAGNESDEGAEDDEHAPQPSKKKRTRNEQQMLQNRVAQQKYRERKKAEHESLQKALDQLTAQLAAMKALEAQASVLGAQNALLTATVNEQAEHITKLTVHAEAQATELAEVRKEAAASAALVQQQQQMILDQHNRLRLQEEVIDALRGRLRDKMEEAFKGHDPKTVCNRMVQAVRAALAGAKNVEGLQSVLEQLPEDIITDICRSILCEVKDMWPELAARLNQLKLACPNTTCAQQVSCS